MNDVHGLAFVDLRAAGGFADELDEALFELLNVLGGGVPFVAGALAGEVDLWIGGGAGDEFVDDGADGAFASQAGVEAGGLGFARLALVGLHLLLVVLAARKNQHKRNE